MSVLALDAGGTSTRAVVLESDGTVLGFGRAGGGNPTSRGIEGAVSAIVAATVRATTMAGERAAVMPGGLAVLAAAGQQLPGFAEEISHRLADHGWHPLTVTHDLLAAFGSGTWQLDGYALIAGTGSVAARVRDGVLAEVVGGRGWLLGDAGSGFWIGHRVAQAVIADLDGQAPPTALTSLVLAATGVPQPGPGRSTRIAALEGLMRVVYGQPPVQLAALAVHPFAVADDPVARQILIDASAALAELVAAVHQPGVDGPVVVGGSVVVQGLLAAPPELRRDLVSIAGGAPVVPVTDGVVGAAVQALRTAGVEVDDELFSRLRVGVELARTALATP